MIVCPVCEHAQAAGAECEVCGKLLAAGASHDAVVAPLEGLEPTVAGAAGAVASARLPDLEPTGHAAVTSRAPAVDPAEAAVLVPTRAAPVDVASEALPDLERTRGELPDDAPTALPVFVTCRYCRTPAMPGERICGRCGMRLPVVAAAAPSPAPEERHCSCGSPLRGPRCPSCGARA